MLVLLNAVFTGSEPALISLREGQLRALERAGGRGERTLVRLARDPGRFLATIQIGLTLASATVLREQVAELEKENEILRKAAACFAREIGR